MPQEPLIIDGWTVTNLPQQYPAEAYEAARREVIEKMRHYPDVAAIMDFGTEPYPGISDIDFYIVFRENAQHMFLPRTVPYSPTTQYLMMHTVLLVSEEFIPSLRYLNPWSRFAPERYIYQAPDFIPRTIHEPEGDTLLLNAAFMLDKLDSIFAHLPYFIQKKLPSRLIFEICKNAVYCIWRLEDLGIPAAPHHTDFIERFRKAREAWFTTDQTEGIRKLIGFFEESIKIAFEIAYLLGHWLDTKITEIPARELGISQKSITKNTPAVYCHTFKYARVFTDMYREEKSREGGIFPRERVGPLSLAAEKFNPLENFHSILKNARAAFEKTLAASELVRVGAFGKTIKQQPLIPVTLPRSLAAFLTTTARARGILSDAVRSDLFANTETVPVINDPNLEKKIELQNTLTANYRSKRIPGGEGKGYIYGNQTFGYLFGEERFLRKVFVWYLRKIFFNKMNLTI